MTTKWLSCQGYPLQGNLHAANQQKKKKTSEFKHQSFSSQLQCSSEFIHRHRTLAPGCQCLNVQPSAFKRRQQPNFECVMSTNWYVYTLLLIVTLFFYRLNPQRKLFAVFACQSSIRNCNYKINYSHKNPTRHL